MRHIRRKRSSPKPSALLVVSYCMRTNQQRSPAALKSAYTRVDLAVTLAIVFVIIMTIAWPIRASLRRDQVHNSMCVSNLKALATAFAQYASDNDNCLPPYANRMELGNGAKIKWNIHDKYGRAIHLNPARPDLLVSSLRPYLGSNAFWFCPSDPMAHTNNLAANHVVGWVSADHRFGSYVTPQTFANYPTTMNGFEFIDSTGVHHVIGGLDASSRDLLGEEYIMVSPPQSWLMHVLPQVSRRAPALYSHSERLNWVSFDGHLHSIAASPN
jgi:hypothetical protein